MVESITRIEILNQPDSLIDTLSTEGEHAEDLAKRIVESNIQRMYFIGCGSSFCASYLGKYMLDVLTNISSDVFTGYEFLQRLPTNVNKNSYVFLTSFSGETEDVIEALKVARKRGAYTVGLTNIRDSTLHREADESFLIRSFEDKPMVGGYFTQVALSYWTCGHISKFSTASSRAEDILQQIKELPRIARNLIETEESKMERLAKKYKDATGFYVLGSGPLYSLAYKLALTMLTENLWMHGCVVHSGEFRHGLIEKTEKGTPMIILEGYEGEKGITERVLRFTQKHGAEIVLFNANEYPKMDEMLAPLILSIPVGWFTYYLALERGRLPEYRRYMGKEPF